MDHPADTAPQPARVPAVKCVECGGAHLEGGDCQDDFHQLLGWETEDFELRFIT